MFLIKMVPAYAGTIFLFVGLWRSSLCLSSMAWCLPPMPADLRKVRNFVPLSSNGYKIR